MEYAIQLILPILGGLLLGNWLTRTYGISPLWTVLLGILGMVMGIRILYKRSLAEQALQKERWPTQKKPATPSPPLQSLKKTQAPRAEPNLSSRGEADDTPKTIAPQHQPEKTGQSSNPPPVRPNTTLNTLHELYQQLGNAPPEEHEDLPPNLDTELNRDDQTHDPKAPPSER